MTAINCVDIALLSDYGLLYTMYQDGDVLTVAIVLRMGIVLANDVPMCTHTHPTNHPTPVLYLYLDH